MYDGYFTYHLTVPQYLCRASTQKKLTFLYAIFTKVQISQRSRAVWSAHLPLTLWKVIWLYASLLHYMQRFNVQCTTEQKNCLSWSVIPKADRRTELSYLFERHSFDNVPTYGVSWNYCIYTYKKRVEYSLSVFSKISSSWTISFTFSVQKHLSCVALHTFCRWGPNYKVT